MRGHRFFRLSTVAAVLVCYVTILIGGNVMASDSGLACPDWPTCHGTFFPPLSGGSGIEWAHRLSALVLSGSIGVLVVSALLFERGRPVLVRFSAAAGLLVFGQAFLGAVVVQSSLSVGLVLLHLALATALFALLLALTFLANFREIPSKWVEFALRASEESPRGAEIPGRSPGPLPPVPSDVGAATRST